LGLLLGKVSPTGRCYDLGFADHRHGLEVEVAKLFPGGSRTSARWRSRRRRLIVLHDTARMGAVGTAHNVRGLDRLELDGPVVVKGTDAIRSKRDVQPG